MTGGDVQKRTKSLVFFPLFCWWAVEGQVNGKIPKLETEFAQHEKRNESLVRQFQGGFFISNFPAERTGCYDRTYPRKTGFHVHSCKQWKLRVTAFYFFMEAL